MLLILFYCVIICLCDNIVLLDEQVFARLEKTMLYAPSFAIQRTTLTIHPCKLFLDNSDVECCPPPVRPSPP